MMYSNKNYYSGTLFWKYQSSDTFNREYDLNPNKAVSCKPGLKLESNASVQGYY